MNGQGQPSVGDIEGQAAAAEPGSAGMSDVDATAQVCSKPILHVGVFFDGTRDNRFNAAAGRVARALGEATAPGSSYDRSESNIAVLERIYRNTRNEPPNACGLHDVYYTSIYITGAGSEAGEDDDGLRGSGMGVGARGVLRKALQGVEEANARISQYGGPTGPEELYIDVFGFSRGAATSRLFANMVAEGMVHYADKLRFLGLLDTVPGMIAATVGDNTGIHGGLNFNVKSSMVDTVVHLTAAHEIRHNFRLLDIRGSGGESIELPGTHGDVGGSTWDHPQRLSYGAADAARLVAEGRLPPGFSYPSADGPTAVRRYESDLFRTPEGTRENPGQTVQYGDETTREVTILPGLKKISLNILYQRALAAEVPFGSLRAEDGVPGPLQGIYGKALGGQTLTDADMQTASQYINPSSVPGDLVNGPEGSLVRGIDPNVPGNASPSRPAFSGQDGFLTPEFFERMGPPSRPELPQMET